jgi:flagellar basal-body rod protein FlgF
MDKLAYLAMSGAKELMLRQARVANNLANAKSIGFKADLSRTLTAPVIGEGLDSRAFALTSGAGYATTAGPLITTGKATDVAIEGEGWFVVQAADGQEALTRNGEWEISAGGILQTRSGLPVLGDAGPIVVPPYETLEIGVDGTVSVRPLGAPENTIQVVGRLKLVDPEPQQLVKREDGLFTTQNGETLPPAASVVVRSGVLEGSNVNTVAELTDLIDVSRRFEMQMKMLSQAERNDRALDRLLQV